MVYFPSLPANSVDRYVLVAKDNSRSNFYLQILQACLLCESKISYIFLDFFDVFDGLSIDLRDNIFAFFFLSIEGRYSKAFISFLLFVHIGFLRLRPSEHLRKDVWVPVCRTSKHILLPLHHPAVSLLQ